MKLSPEVELVTAVVASAMIFFLGRYSVKFDTTKTTMQDSKDTKNRTITTVVTTKDPNGATKTVATTDSTTTDKGVIKVDTVTKVASKSTTNISVLISNAAVKDHFLPTYGLSVTKEMVGPFTIGAFGITNGTLGISVGVNF
jgi:VCBS repeat-containing protein